MQNKLKNFIRKRLPAAVFILFYLFFCLFTYKNYGLTVDEFFVYTRGRYFYTKVRGNDKKLQKGFVIKERNNDDLLYNNSSYPALLYMFNGQENYEKYHLLNLLFAILIFYLFYEILLFFYKKTLLALVGPLFLFFTPRFFGDIPANPKDVPFAILYFSSIAAIYFSQFWSEKLGLIVIGILIGLTGSLRILGFSLLFLYFIYKIIGLRSTKKITFSNIFDLLLNLTIIFFISFVIFFASMPYVAADPFNNLIELLKVANKFPWYGKILLFAKQYSPDQRPLSYLPIWFLITTPLFIILFFLGGLFIKIDKTKNRFVKIIILSLLLQSVIYCFFKPTIYNGLRHYLFLLPQIVILAAIYFIEKINSRGIIKWFVISLTLINIVFIAKSYIELHPYEYTYFNCLIGGLKGAAGKFETDYWGASEKEALLWLKNYLKQKGITKTNVYTCSKSHSNQYYLPEHNDVNTKIQKANYAVCNDDESVQKSWAGKKTTLIHAVKRQGIVFNYIFKIN